MTKHGKRLRKRAPIVVHKRQETVTPPGTIAPPPDAPHPKITAISYGPETLDEHDVDDATALSDLRGKAPILWVNIEGVGDASTFRELGSQFGLHPLALEDVVNLHQRPKTEDYDDHAYVVLQTPCGTDALSFEQLSLFFGPDYVVTVQERPGGCLDPVRERVRRARGRIRKAGTDYLAYTILDTIVDNYFPHVERLNAHLEVLEEQVIRSADEATVTEIHAIRHDLHALRRVLAPSREAVGFLARGTAGPVTEETLLFLRDCQDHTAQLLDAVDACRELSTGLIELHLSGVSNRMNEVMKVLTLIATIFIPLGFIAGVYGMNFDRTSSPWNMPELGWYLGYPLALALMLTTSLGFVLFFRRRGWLGRPRKSERERDNDEHRP